MNTHYDDEDTSSDTPILFTPLTADIDVDDDGVVTVTTSLDDEGYSDGDVDLDYFMFGEG